ncbi:uncharacterized protein LOC122502697 [Leptopilina heterotoma]|uniref:uncharacterized protein LOC122502697 n=1 Tax=Leptopilina heterotoma TaxID=63436 RepID=UPI001CA84C15|nr:uncharacterized protein LOC122502697 [Leptopilina heterotoma]
MSNEQENTNPITSTEEINVETGLIQSNALPHKEVPKNSENKLITLCHMITNFYAIQLAYNLIPIFDGTSSVFDFIDDIDSAISRPFVLRSVCDERQIVRMILNKLRGNPRKCTKIKNFKNVEDLTDLLKRRFAPKRPFEDYIDEIRNIRIYRNETPLDEFYNRLEILVSKTRAAWKYQNNCDMENGLMSYVQHVAIKSFIRALPCHWGELIWAKKPKDLLDAFFHVRDLEETRA